MEHIRRSIPVTIAVLLIFNLGCASTATSPPKRQFDPDAARDQAAQERQKHHLAIRFRFVGEFTDGGLPTTRVRAIPVDQDDLRFVITTRIVRLVEGELPPGIHDELVFAMHSPALFFRRQGILIERGTYFPKGVFLMTLWASQDGNTLDLEVVPFREAAPS